MSVQPLPSPPPAPNAAAARPPTEAPAADHRSGCVAVVGSPNAGKSTLINALLGEKLSIVSSKPQTTRQALRGILTVPGTQLVIVDTPGFCSPQSILHRTMRKTVGTTAAAAEVVLLVCDVARAGRHGWSEAQQQIVEVARSAGQPLVVALNKVDLLERRELALPLIAQVHAQLAPAAIVPVVARRGEGLPKLLAALRAQLPAAPADWPAEAWTDRSERFLCGEMIREQILRRTEQEVPHACAVTVEAFADERDRVPPRCTLEARIWVAKTSQRGILVGRGGQQIRAIGTEARARMGELLGCRVDLRLTVHVEADWPEDEAALRRLGLAEVPAC